MSMVQPCVCGKQPTHTIDESNVCGVIYQIQCLNEDCEEQPDIRAYVDEADARDQWDTVVDNLTKKAKGEWDDE